MTRFTIRVVAFLLLWVGFASGSGIQNPGGGSPIDATYWTQSPNATLTNEFNLGSLTTGLLQIVVSDGIATPSTFTSEFCTAGQQVADGINGTGSPRCVEVAGTHFVPQSPNTIFSGPASGVPSVEPTFRLLVTADIPNDAVTYAKIQNVTDARLLGRSAGSAGDAQEITVGAGLSLAAGALTATGGSGTTINFNRQTADATVASTTLIDIHADLGWTAAASTNYAFRCVLSYSTASAAVGMALAMNGPATPTEVFYAAVIHITANGSVHSGIGTAYDTKVTGTQATTAAQVAHIEGFVRNGLNTGTIIPRFSNETGTTVITVQAGSHCKWHTF